MISDKPLSLKGGVDMDWLNGPVSGFNWKGVFACYTGSTETRIFRQEFHVVSVLREFTLKWIE